jgi:chaperonin cofactor prefoldin
MNVRLMKCPACGAALEAENRANTMTCRFCDAVLEVTRDASGMPLARLAEVKVDTSFLAKERARDRLGRRIEDIDDEIDALEREGNELLSRIRARIRPWTYAAIVLVGVWALAGSALGSAWWRLLAGLVLGAATAYGLNKVLRAQTEPIVEEYQGRVDALEQEREELDAQVQRLDAELDELSMRV